MNDADFLYLGTHVSLDSIVVDPAEWGGAFELEFTDEGDTRDGNWHADNCLPTTPGEGEIDVVNFHPAPYVEFCPFSKEGRCTDELTTGVGFDTSPDGTVWEVRVNLSTSELDKIGPEECFRFGSRLHFDACELGSGCGPQGGNWLEGQGIWPEGSTSDNWPDSLGTLCLSPCQEGFVPEPGTLLLLGSGIAGLAGYAALRRQTA